MAKQNSSKRDEATQANDPIFEAEQAHLRELYAQLKAMQANLQAKMDATRAQAAVDKQTMMEDIAPNLSSFDEALESYAAYATVNTVIDSYNISQESSARKLADVRLLLRQPYFAKIALRYKEGEPPRELYIGAAGVADDDYKRLVVDWRSPVAEVYYNQDMGRTSYVANGRKIAVELELRRQFDICRDQLRAYFDTNIAIQDELLLESLSRARTPRMKAITATIQKEQNTVVRADDAPALLVVGVAGSGKTSVLLQRIAYLFYRQRDTLRPDQVVLITPNPVFRRYIQDVLPDMGESNPRSLTWREFAEAILPEGRCGGNMDVPIEVLRRIDALVPQICFDAGDFNAVKFEDVRFVSPAQIMQTMQRYAKIAPGPRRITLVREEILKRIGTRLKKMAHSDVVVDEVAALPTNEQLRIFHETVDVYEADDPYPLALAYLQDKFAPVMAQIERDEWLKLDRIGMRMLGLPHLDAPVWLYLKAALCGAGNADARYVMVDEVQDYTAAQLAVLAAYFRRAHFLALGDPMQAIETHSAAWPEICEVFERTRGQVCECRLNVSYRSTPQITQMFAALAAGASSAGSGGASAGASSAANIQIESVQPDGAPPTIIKCADDAEWERELRRVLVEASERHAGLCAVIVPWKSEAKRLAKVLGADCPLLVDDGDELPANSTILIALKHAKGLEFDHVIVPDVSSVAFPEDDLSRRRLYTTISRATKTLTMLSRGQKTALLEI